MTFEENTPRKSHNLTPLSDCGTELVVQGPDAKAAQEHTQSIPNHKPHGLESLHIADILVVLMFFGRYRQSLLFACYAVFLARVSPSRTKGHLHCVHTPQDYDGGQYRVGVLVEHGVLQVVVVEGDENGQRREGNGQDNADAGGSRVRKGRIAHQTRSINHGELIDQLHGV